jgi:DNA-binding response OmpR family regulator
MPNMLIADDNRQISSILTEYAKKDGFTVFRAYDGKEALKVFQGGKFDMVLLDVMMPEKDGFEVCREIRAQSNVPIIMITARGEDFERIMGLDIGADDYIVKPFSPGEVMARVRAILRRMERSPESASASQVLRSGDLTVDLDHFTVKIGQQVIPLTKKETELLWTLAAAPGRVFTRDNLLDLLWGSDYYGDNRTVDSHIKRLRQKLDAIPHEGWEIKTIWGVGYRFDS